MQGFAGHQQQLTLVSVHKPLHKKNTSQAVHTMKDLCDNLTWTKLEAYSDLHIYIYLSALPKLTEQANTVANDFFTDKHRTS